MIFQRFLLLLLVAISFLPLSCDLAAQPWTISVVDYLIELNPAANSGAKKIDVPAGKQCKKNKHDGCLLFEVDTIGAITFSLRGSADKQSCADLASNSAKQVITKVELSTTPQQNDMEVGVFGDRVEAWLKHDAFPGVDMSSGLLYEAELRDALTSVSVYNENKHPHVQGRPRQFWYKVTVTDCEDPRKIWVFDPRGDNEGVH